MRKIRIRQADLEKRKDFHLMEKSFWKYMKKVLTRTRIRFIFESADSLSGCGLAE